LELQRPPQDLSVKNNGFYFATPGLLRHNLLIGFAFDAGNYRNFYFGFFTKDPKERCPLKEELFSAFADQFPQNDGSNDYWPASAYWEQPYRDWGQEAFEAIRSDQFAKDLNAKLETLATIAKQVCP